MASGVSAYALAISYGGKRVATVFATMNMSGNLGATVFPIAVGTLDRDGNGELELRPAPVRRHVRHCGDLLGVSEPEGYAV